MSCVSPLKGWRNRETGGIVFRRDDTSETMEVACGQCIGCRIDRRREWAMRIVHESSMHEYNGGNCFITLTYRDIGECDFKQWRNGFHVPSDWSLHKHHFQKFMKRLRRFFGEQRIRYFVAGEYGVKCKHGIDVERIGCPVCNTGRPHYHACLFNASFPDLVSYGSGPHGLRYTSPALEKIWKYGFVDVSELNFTTAEYVAGYVLKKVTGVKQDEYYTSFDLDGNLTYLTPEYADMTRGHRCAFHKTLGYTDPECENCSLGIGHSWFEKYHSDVFPHDTVPVPGKGVIRGVPRYYEEIFKEENPISFEAIKASRQAFMREHMADFTPQRLESKYKIMKARQGLKSGLL